eukprot:GFYU01008252.1.p1 GENE.GFYU01008252.1~~GFYU01008252.1.p1  ORF type:complete len:790 (-),score=142.04 GFYU01008252.1:44-2344(-)
MAADLPRWTPTPTGDDGLLKTLRVSNSLTDSKVDFVPADGKKVKWYACGPTVYDSAHLGHARTYLTFDIIRRLMEDYFGYDLYFVMNITDIDDKIILKARRNYLIEKYLESGVSAEAATKDITEAFEKNFAKHDAKLAELKADLDAASGSQKTELQTLVDQENLKRGNVTKSQEAFVKAKAAGSIPEMVAAAKDVLSEKLDAQQGSEVSDHTIFRAHTSKYEKEFLDDMDALGVRPPDVLTRVTEYVPGIIEFVSKIISEGFAYEANGSVYFSVSEFSSKHRYAKLSRSSVGNLALAAEGEGALAAADSEKRHPYDFALWKKSKPGEPEWDSPWGKGRPGWHIECSSMASELFGSNMDIHSGGVDLKFPHHDNELAQSEAYHGCHQWVNYFLHTGHLHIDGLKMSKSLKNFISIKEALNLMTSRQWRLFFLSQPWDKPVSFNLGDSSSIKATKSRESTFKEFFLNMKSVIRQQESINACDQGWSADDKQMNDSVLSCQQNVHQALLNNFDTPKALEAMLDLINDVNKYISKCAATSAAPKVLIIEKAAHYVTRILACFGVIDLRADFGFPSTSGGQSTEAALTPFLDAFCTFRDQIRGFAREKAAPVEFLKASDQIRDDVMPRLGVRMEDGTGASVWKLDDAETLMKERAEKIAKAQEQALAKLKNKRTLESKKLDKWAKSAVSPTNLFAAKTDKYSKFDDKGIPTHDLAGEPLSGKARKNAEKDYDKQAKLYADYQAAIEKDADFMANLQKEIDRIDSEIASLSL